MTRDNLLVKVNGRGFDTDPSQIGWQTIPVSRDSVDQGAGAGEQSLSNGTVWRRSRDDQIEGAGQHYADLLPDGESSRLRFWTSHGINPWTRRQLTLHHATHHAKTMTAPTIQMVTVVQAGVEYIFAIDDIPGGVYRSIDPDAGFSACTGHGANPKKAITTDGTRVWISDGTDVYALTTGTAFTVFSSVDTDLVGYASGRLLATKGNRLFELDNTGAMVGTGIFTHPSTAFVWDGIIPSPGGIYCFGHLGNRTEIYNVTVIDATGALDVPIHAGELPDGETLNTMVFYLGVMVLGTSHGIRLALITGGGFLSTGPVIEEPGSVRCLEPQGDDVWFGWSNIAGSGSGLGRLRLSRFTADLVPAYAADLAAASVSGVTTSVITFGGRRVFAIGGSGIWNETTDYVTAGQIDFGYFSYGIPENKLIDSLALWCTALPVNTTINAKVYAEDDTTTPVLDATLISDGVTKANYTAALQTAAERYRVVVTLTSAAVAATPTLRRFTLRVAPQPFVSQLITMPLFIADKVSGEGSGNYELDVYDEWTRLQVLLLARTRFQLQLGAWTTIARLEALEVTVRISGENGLNGWDRAKHFLQGRWMATFTTLEPVSG